MKLSVTLTAIDSHTGAVVDFVDLTGEDGRAVARAVIRGRMWLRNEKKPEPTILKRVSDMLGNVTEGQPPSPRVTRPAAHETSSSDAEYLTRQQAAQIAQFSLSTLDRRISSGQLRAVKNGQIVRIRRQDLERHLAP